MKNIYQIATEYSKKGLVVVPIVKGQKHPAIDWKKYQNQRPTDEELKTWFENKDVGIGLITGKLSGIVVVDEDSYKKTGSDLKLNTPLRVLTGGGGKHYYFKYQDGVTNTVNQSKAVDIRGEGGLVVIPPTIHPSGNQYRWDKTGEVDIKNLPTIDENFLSQIIDHQRKGEKINISNYLSVEEGGRNNSLHKIACSIRNKYKRDEAIAILAGINNGYNPPLEDFEFQQVINSAFNFVESNPPQKLHDKFVQTMTPETIKEVGERRIAERVLEKDAPSTGFPELDKSIKGFIPKHLIVLSGETNCGKTALCCNFAERLAKQGRNILYFALEPDTTVVDYLATIRTKKTFDKLTDSDIVFDDGGKIKIVMNVQTYESLAEIITKQEERFDLIVIDHIGYFANGENKVQQESILLKQLAKFANDQKSTIIVIAHPRKRLVKEKDNKTYDVLDINDIAGSASFKQDADEILILARRIEKQDEFTSKYSNEGKIVIKKTKSTGTQDSVDLIFSPYSGFITTLGEMAKIAEEGKTKKINFDQEKEESDASKAINDLLMFSRKKVRA